MPTIQFKGKNIIWNHHLSVPYHILEESEGLSFEAYRANGNLIIEGDNLMALKALLPQYGGRVKCIYIDPPYNTGKEDWVYSDKVNSPLIAQWLNTVVAKDDLTRHDKWACMIVPRLRLLRELLTSDGVIMISCDDNEYSNLKSLMNEIFTESNFVGTLVWRNATDNNPTNIATEHEYILFYAKDKEKIPPVWKSSVSIAKEELVKVGRELTEKFTGQEALQEAYTMWFRENRPFLGKLDRYKFIDAGGVYTGSQSVHNPGREGYRYDIPHPETNKPTKQPLMGYRFPEATMQELLTQKKILFGNDENKIIELKVYAHEYEDKLASVFELDGRLGAYDLKELFGKVPFKNPKPVQLLTHILPFVTSNSDIILDSFAGSGTTLHAVMELNNEDGGTRQCNLVQMKEDTTDEPGKNVCKDITRERVKRAIEKYGFKSGFMYLKVGIPIDPESMLEGNLPSYEQFAQYVYYLATGEYLAEKDKIENAKYYVGTRGHHAIFLIYEQEMDKLTRLALNLDAAKQIIQNNPNKRRIVYAPACFLDDDYMEEHQIEFVSIPYSLFERKQSS